jgi:hypothetical protein
MAQQSRNATKNRFMTIFRNFKTEVRFEVDPETGNAL